MYDEIITMDVDRFKQDMKNDCLGTYFGVGIGEALMEATVTDFILGGKLIC